MQITIDIERGTLEALSARIETTFPLDEFTRARLVNGWDDIGLTLRYEDEIETYEAAAFVAPHHPLTDGSHCHVTRGCRGRQVGLESPPGPRRRLPRGAGGQPASGDPVDVELRNVLPLRNFDLVRHIVRMLSSAANDCSCINGTRTGGPNTDQRTPTAVQCALTSLK